MLMAMHHLVNQEVNGLTPLSAAKAMWVNCESSSEHDPLLQFDLRVRAKSDHHFGRGDAVELKPMAQTRTAPAGSSGRGGSAEGPR